MSSKSSLVENHKLKIICFFLTIPGPTDGDLVATTYGKYVLHTFRDLMYPQAIALCKVSGGQIAAFETKLEYEAVKPHLETPVFTQFWLNGNDKRQDGKLIDHKI